jgi:hypothetical protein
MKMRAKLTVEHVATTEQSDLVKFRALYSDTKEDNSYAKSTPNATLDMQIDNPALRGQLKAGQKFYVDFTPIE